MKNQPGNRIAYLYLLATFFLWGSLYVVSSYATSILPVSVVVCARYVLALIPLSLMAGKKLKTKIAREDIKYFLLIAALGYYLTVTVNTLGIKYAGAYTSSLINAMVPVGVTIVAALVLREKIDMVRIACLALAIAGTCIVVTGSSGSAQIIGILLTVLSMLTWSVSSVYIKKMTEKYPPIFVTTCAIALSLLLHLPSAAIDIVREGGLRLTTSAVLSLLYMGLLTTGLAQYLWSKSLSMLEAGVCSLFYPLQPVFSAILGVIFLKEQLGTSFYIGAAFILSNVLLNCLWSERKRRQASLPAPEDAMREAPAAGDAPTGGDNPATNA